MSMGFFAAGAIGQGGGGGGAYPVLEEVGLALSAGTVATSHPISMPAAVNTGDLLIVILGAASSSSIAFSTPSGWTQLLVDGTTRQQSAYYRVADGTEGGATVAFVGTSSRALAYCYRFRAGSYSLVPEGAFNTAANPACPTVSPTWGASESAVIATLYTQANSVTVTSYPQPGNQARASPSAANPFTLAICDGQFNTSSISPGTWAGTGFSNSRTMTIAIRGA